MVEKKTREALDALRKDLRKLSNDLIATSKSIKDTTEKFVEDAGPKVSAGLDDTGEAIRQTIRAIDKETRPQQSKLLRAYKKFLSRQMNMIEERLKRIE